MVWEERKVVGQTGTRKRGERGMREEGRGNKGHPMIAEDGKEVRSKISKDWTQRHERLLSLSLKRYCVEISLYHSLYK